MNEKIHLTIEDIAAMAGVSISTVSRVMNNSAPVSKKTKNKILKIIEKTQYSPNALARGLRTGSKTIGLLIPDITNHFFIELVKGIEDILNEKGYSAFLCNTNWDPERDKHYFNLMMERRVEGFIIMATFFDESLISNLPNKEIQVVSIQNRIKGIDSVFCKDWEGAFMATEHLINLGHEQIAFLGFENIVDSLRNRLNGYKEALTKHGVLINEEYILLCEPYGDFGYHITQQLFELPTLPTAILTINDQMATGVYRALKEKGLSIPDDISIIGFDNISISELLHPKLTTVAQPTYEIGKTAATLLLERISNNKEEMEREIVLPTRLIVRESTAKRKNL